MLIQVQMYHLSIMCIFVTNYLHSTVVSSNVSNSTELHSAPSYGTEKSFGLRMCHLESNSSF